MHLPALRYLVAVADEGNFGRAALRMHVSQPSVSQAIARLERQFGARLLDRSGAHVVPTEAGERVLAEVRLALRHLDGALAIAASVPRPCLRIAFTPFASMWLTAQLLAPFREAHPELETSVAELDVPAQLVAVLRGDSHLAVGEPLPEHPRLRQTVIREEPCAIWMSNDHPLARYPVIAIEALDGVPLANSGSHVRPGYDEWVRATLESAGLTATFAAPAHDTPSGISRMLDGEMVSLSPDILRAGAIPGLTSRPVDHPVRWRWMGTMLRDTPSASSLTFVAWACRRQVTASFR